MSFRRRLWAILVIASVWSCRDNAVVPPTQIYDSVLVVGEIRQLPADSVENLTIDTTGDTITAKDANGNEYRILKSVVPAVGVDVLVYDADTTSTASVASTTTDTNGVWECWLSPGRYFVFGIYFDIVNRSIVTASINPFVVNATQRIQVAPCMGCD